MTRHFKFINAKTGNVIYYHSLASHLTDNEVKIALDAVKAQVAIANGMYIDNIYWEEIK